MIYDLAVIGGGPAGYSAALEAVRYKLKVILFEKELVGGTCLNRGCVPTKFLSHMANVYMEANSAASNGMIKCAEITVDYAKIAKRKSEVVSMLRNSLKQHMLQQKITIIADEAHIKDREHIICREKEFKVRNILIATGSIASAPLVEGAITSDSLLEINDIPDSLYILGGGTAAVEFAHIFHAFGSKVTLFHRENRILRKWDKEIALSMMQIMKKRGIKIESIDNFSDIQLADADVVLSATGRIPNIAGSEVLYVDIGQGGGIVTDECGRTRTDGIFAAGDVVEGSSQLAHVGMAQGKRIAQYIAGAPIAKHASVVSCIYMGQEIASVGLTEEEAKKQNQAIITAKQNMYSNARTMISTAERGFIKLIADKNLNRLVGAQLMCERAGDIVSELALAINNGLSPRALFESTRPHPSYCEAVTDAAALLVERMG